MEPNIHFFVLQREGTPLLVRRGQYLGLPYAMPAEHSSPRHEIDHAFGGIAHIVSHGVLEPLDTDRRFEFDGKPAFPRFFIMRNYRFVAPMCSHASFHFSFAECEADVFVRYLETVRPNLFVQMFAA